GVDVWLNNPRRPWEASGTSGMKVLVNGGLNLSELDGWWDEAYQPEVGWALGDGKSHGNDSSWDNMEAEQLYDLLEKEIIPEFYNRDEAGIPRTWIAKIRQSMSLLTPRFSTNRTLIEYVSKYYLPAAEAFKKRLAANGEIGSRIIHWKQVLRENWQKIKFGDFIVEPVEDHYAFNIKIYLSAIRPEHVSVELYANGLDGTKPIQVMMNCTSVDNSEDQEYRYYGEVDSSRSHTDYTIRIIPLFEGVSVPLEEKLILWHH
ncbi:MAG TPA: hypothetical protein VK957_09505, partial [Lunatimonas sp.]|nr:hypothetical protein [Lunatimonas sp.]